MGKSNMTLVIYIDTNASAIKFCTMAPAGADTISDDVKKFSGNAFTSDFYDKFSSIVNDYCQSNPSLMTADVTIVVPDRVIATDIVNVPSLRWKKATMALDTTIESIYKNMSDLKITRAQIAQNKQFSTYALAIIRNEIVTSLTEACQKAKITPRCITFVANTTVNAVQMLNSRLRSSTYMVLDIKSNYTEIAMVQKGRTAGFYSLPFGYSVLYKSRLTAEDLLFEHTMADLAVLNAKEKAKAKQLTMVQDDSVTQVGQALADDEESETDTEENEEVEEDTVNNLTSDVSLVKTLPKKSARVLPKYMMRPTPHGDQEYISENFRIFVKWALNLIQANEKTIFKDAPEAVYVNIPDDYKFVFETVNLESEENKVSFVPLDFQGQRDYVIQNLEVYGGLFSDTFNRTNNF